MARLYLRCVYKYGKDVLYTPPASPDYPSNNLFCKRALRCAISMTGRWSLSRGFSSPVYLVFLAPSCVSLSLSHFRFLPWHALCVPTCRIGCNSTCPFRRKKRPGRSPPWPQEIPIQLFFFFFLRGWLIENPVRFCCFFLWLTVRSLSRKRQTRV